MLSSQQIVVLGAGNMGRALIGGLHKIDQLPAENIFATRRTQTSLDQLANDFEGIRTGSDNIEAVKQASVIILSVKPQYVVKVLAEIKDYIPENALLISILAGVTTASLEGSLGNNVAVVRSMPNTPSLVDEGATAICAGRHATENHLKIAEEIFASVGRVETIAESLMDAVTGLSGSGPAYVYMIIEALTDGGVKQGIPRKKALQLAAQTVYGAAKLVLETGKHPAILRDEVTTPGGTAIAAVADLEDHGLRTMLINAVATATKRSKELSEL